MENVPQPIARSRDQAAVAVGVSGKLVSAAKAIREAEEKTKVQSGLLQQKADTVKESANQPGATVEKVPHLEKSRDQPAVAVGWKLGKRCGPAPTRQTG